MTAYHYQCANCGCTLYADSLDEGEDYSYVMNGELCSSCKAKRGGQYNSNLYYDSNVYYDEIYDYDDW
ncbi:MAG: hypothetical protein KC550_05775 [Nanoarchaeota archaeon]|nr:hypothetical protein [Nanoarchaeota archaeon]